MLLAGERLNGAMKPSFFDGRPISKVGIVFFRTCRTCHSPAWWEYRTVNHYVVIQLAFRFLTRQDHWIVCPICKHGYQIAGESLTETAALVNLNSAYYTEHSITAEAFQASCEANAVWQTYADRPPGGTGELGERRTGADGNSYIWVGAPDGWVLALAGRRRTPI